MDNCINNQDLIEFVLVDFNSIDGLEKWIVNDFKKELKSGFLKYFITPELTSWHASIAKNTAHKLASGNILVNLDCDNLIGYGGDVFVLDQFRNQGKNIVLHQASIDPAAGNYGRISMLKTFFMSIGGYNESFNPMGYQDTDLILRLKEIGLEYIVASNSKYNQAFPNSKDQGLIFTNSSKSYIAMVTENQAMSRENIRLGKIRVNKNSIGISNNIRQIF